MSECQTFYDRVRDGLVPHIKAMGATKAAKATGIDRGSIQHWMAGRRGMPPRNVEALAKAAGASVVVRVVKRVK